MSPTLQTLLPVAAGLVVVVLGILFFRLHAFFALLLAAATTATCTPWQAIYRHRLEPAKPFAELVRVNAPKEVWMRRPDERRARHLVTEFELRAPASVFRSDEWYVVDPDRFAWSGHYRAVLKAHGYVLPQNYNPFNPPANIGAREWHVLVHPEKAVFDDLGGQPADFRRGSRDISRYRPRPTDVIIPKSALKKIRFGPAPPVPARIADAFGDTVGSIGLLIAFASVIGMCLLDSGAADRIVRSALRLVGERGAPLAFASCGFLLGVPVFFDTVFLLMIPLGKALNLRTGRNYVLYVLTIVCGATMAHSLVPPTPGPLLVAEALHVNIGTMILVGGAVGLVASSYGVAHAFVANRLLHVPLRDTPEMPLADLERLAAKPDHELPPLWLSLLPIVLPVWLIGQQAALEILIKEPPEALAGLAKQIPAWVVTVADTLGEKNVAVGIGVVIALVLLTRQTGRTLGQVRDKVGAALAAGGAIILITAAGGAFGKTIEQTGVASLLKEMPAFGPAGLLAVAFVVTTAIRTAQGSATVAMITAVGLFQGIELPFHPVWLAVAIGCGSKPFSWMTDSGFWVICKMSGMTEAETLKALTPMTAMMGLVGLAATIAGAVLFPMK